MTGPAVPALSTLFFSDTRQQDGRYSVLDPQGQPVALIDSARTNRSFIAVAGNAAPLCSGKSHGLFKPSVEVVDAAGAPIATLRSKLVTNGRVVELPGGRMLTIGATVMTRTWTMTDESGEVLIEADARGSGLGLHAAAYVVRHHPELGLPEVVGVVAAYRMALKSRGGSASN